jgi:hypothetical protein
MKFIRYYRKIIKFDILNYIIILREVLIYFRDIRILCCASTVDLRQLTVDVRQMTAGLVMLAEAFKALYYWADNAGRRHLTQIVI